MSSTRLDRRDYRPEDKTAFEEFKKDQSVLEDCSAISSELSEAMDQVREHNDAGMSRSGNNAVDKLVLRFADTTKLRVFTDQVPVSRGTTRYTYWMDNSTRSRHRLFGDPGRFWPKTAYDKRNKSHEPDTENRVS